MRSDEFIVVADLSWDTFNLEHITQHGVTPGEVEEVCRGRQIALRTYKGRYIVVGSTAAGRLLTIILAEVREGSIFYAISARSASVRERRWYRQREGHSR